MAGTSLHECLHSFPGAVLEVSADGVVLGSNGRLDGAVGRDLVGCPLAGALDDTSRRKWSRILAPDEGDDPDSPWELVFHTAGSMELRTFLVVRGGSGADRRLWLLEHAPSRRAERLYDEISELNAELVQAQRDLAREQKRISAALLDATAAVAARDEVLAFVSHDLRNPLQTILMAAELLELPITDERKAVQLRAIKGAARGMSRLIEDLLSVSEVEAGRVSLEVEPVLLDALFEEVCGQFENLARLQRQQLQWRVAPDVPTVPGDRHRLRQALSNLVGNAVKFTPEGGEVLLQAVSAGGGVVVSVEDTGVGIPEEDLPRIFTRFWHAGRANRGGAGLGLAITKGIVEAHGGRLHVESAAGAGTKFFFTLAVDDPRADGP
ncbi:MAG TPA: HAMP domain-containing sensor histidine kinase [Longimicrobiaceae bacterium]|nr:HAMP domain-containing sensor histidine kinase [Longimicrobiaceae bacterium]